MSKLGDIEESQVALAAFVCIFTLVITVCCGVGQAEELKFRQDLSGDGRPEMVVVKEVLEEEREGVAVRQAIETRITILKPDGSVAAEATAYNGKPKVDFVNLGKDRRRQVALWTMGGQHYTNLKIFEYRDGKLAELFSNGSACEVVVNFKARQPTIRVGRSNWSDPEWNYATGKRLWNVYSWNGKAFVFDSKKSTAKETTEDEEMGQYLGEVMGKAGR